MGKKQTNRKTLEGRDNPQSSCWITQCTSGTQSLGCYDGTLTEELELVVEHTCGVSFPPPSFALPLSSCMDRKARDTWVNVPLCCESSSHVSGTRRPIPSDLVVVSNQVPFTRNWCFRSSWHWVSSSTSGGVGKDGGKAFGKSTSASVCLQRNDASCNNWALQHFGLLETCCSISLGSKYLSSEKK